MQAREVEKQLEALLKANKGKVLAEDVVYQPTGERIARRWARSPTTRI